MAHLSLDTLSRYAHAMQNSRYVEDLVFQIICHDERETIHKGIIQKSNFQAANES
jgi:hypothetical protein